MSTNISTTSTEKRKTRYRVGRRLIRDDTCGSILFCACRISVCGVVVVVLAARIGWKVREAPQTKLTAVHQYCLFFESNGLSLIFDWAVISALESLIICVCGTDPSPCHRDGLVFSREKINLFGKYRFCAHTHAARTPK